jgi:hypothetical protein
VVNPSISTNPERAKRSLPARAAWRPWVTWALLLGLAAETYLLLRDLSPDRSPASAAAATSAPLIGELAGLRSSVKIQNEGEIVWEDARASQPLYRRQSLLTPAGGRADVAFLDGTGLMVDENSLIVLEKTPADDSAEYTHIIIKLLRGTLHKSSPRKSSDLLRRLGGPAGRTPEIEIDAGDSRIEVLPSTELSVTASPEAQGGARLVVRAGEAKIGALAVHPGEEALLPASGSNRAPVARKLPFNLLSPKIGQTIESGGESRPVRFRWNASREVAAGQPQEVEVSPDPEFKSGVVTGHIPAAEPPLEYVEINVTLPPSNRPRRWYWRVKASQTSDTQSFWMSPPPTPRLRYPADHAHAREGAPIDFAWTALDAATGYELGIGERAPIETRDVFARAGGFATGELRWRVRAKLKDGTLSEWSPYRELLVEPESAEATPPAAAASPMATPGDQAPPPPEEIDEPEIRPAAPAPGPAHTSWWDWLVPPAYAKEAPGAARWLVHLRWKAVRGAARYHVQVSRDRSFKHVVGEADTETPEWDWNFKLGMQNSKGRAFFRVASVSAGGKAGAYSKPKPIAIPSSILAPSPSPSIANETYAAQDLSPDAQAVGVGDAAEASDLSSLARHGARSTPRVREFALGGSASKRAHARERDQSKLARTTEPAPPAPPVPPLAGSASKSGPAAASYLRVPEPSSPRLWSGGAEASLAAGYGSLSQTSRAPDLTSVSPQAPYLQQKLSVVAEIAMTEDARTQALRGEFTLSTAGFSAPDSNPSQPSIKGTSFRASALYSWAKTAGAWNAYAGVSLDRSYRWVAAAGGLSVDSLGALSLGPSLRVVRAYHYTGFFGPSEAGAAIDAPLSGGLTGGQLGAQGRIWGEWNLAKLSQQDENPAALALKAEIEGAYLRWDSPASTSTVAWTFWVAPSLRF